MSEAEADRYTVPGLERGLRILCEFSRREPGKQSAARGELHSPFWINCPHRHGVVHDRRRELSHQ